MPAGAHFILSCGSYRLFGSQDDPSQSSQCPKIRPAKTNTLFIEATYLTQQLLNNILNYLSPQEKVRANHIPQVTLGHPDILHTDTSNFPSLSSTSSKLLPVTSILALGDGKLDDAVIVVADRGELCGVKDGFGDWVEVGCSEGEEEVVDVAELLVVMVGLDCDI